VRKEMLEAALDYYQGFLEDHQGDTSVGVELSEAQAYVARILAELSAFEDFDRIDASASLLSEPTVQKALNLSADQISRAGSINSDTNSRGFGGEPMSDKHAPPPDFQNMTEEEKQKQFAASATAVEASLKALLTPQQLSRLKQISRQVRAPASFSDSDVTDALAPSREEKEDIRRAQAAYRIAIRKAFGQHGPDGPGGPDGPDHAPDHAYGPGGPGGPGDAGGPPQDTTDAFNDAQTSARDDAVGQILARLSPMQRDTWKKMTGEPFDGPLSLPFGPGGPGRGRPGHRHSASDHGGPGRGGSGSEWPEQGGGHGGPDHDGPARDGPAHDGPDHGEPGGPGFGPPPGELQDRSDPADHSRFGRPPSNDAEPQILDTLEDYTAFLEGLRPRSGLYEPPATGIWKRVVARDERVCGFGSPRRQGTAAHLTVPCPFASRNFR
jgi:hypothetical protein